MCEECTAINNRIGAVEAQLAAIRQTLSRIAHCTERMDDHVSFVEAVYRKVSAPVAYVLGVVLPRKQPRISDDEFSDISDTSEPSEVPEYYTTELS
jgi:hypothetical protein